MTNHRIENNFTKIPNEILEALYETKLTVYEYRVLLFIIRKTYGWNKETDRIALSQFSEGTHIHEKSNVSRTLRKLERRNIIIRKSNHHIGLQKTCYAWRQEPKQLRNTHRDII